MKKRIIDNYRIEVNGTTDEIRDLIKGIITYHSRCKHDYLQKEIGGLEQIMHLEQYNLTTSHRIYYKYDTFYFIPNCGSRQAQQLHYRAFKPTFDKAYKEVEDKYDAKLRRDS